LFCFILFCLTCLLQHTLHTDNIMKVKNINGTSSARYTIPNLKEKYIAAGGTNARTCQVNGCSQPNRATAHVHKVNGNDKWHLTQLCASHNHHSNTKPMSVSKGSLVSVKKVQKK